MTEGNSGNLVAVDNKNRIRVWNDSSLNKSKLLKNNKSESIKSIAFFQKELLAVANTKIEIWNLTNDSLITTLTEHKGVVNVLVSIKFLNKTYLLSGSDDNTIRVWDEQLKNIQTLRNHSGSVTLLAYNPSRQLVASSAIDNSIKIWSSSFKLEAEKKSAHNSWILKICVLNNDYIATGSEDGEVKIWKKKENESSLQLITSLKEHTSYVNALVVLKNKSLVSSSLDETIKIWNQINETSFKCINTLKQQNSEIY